MSRSTLVRRLTVATASAALCLGLAASPSAARSGSAAGPAAAAPASSQRAQARPNVVVILVDDLGWNDVSYAGSTFYQTPAIDQLAQDGMRFDNAHVAFPRCAPSRFALMTGKFPARAGVPGGPGGEDADASEFTLAEAFKAGGYATFFAGKWHIGKTPDQMPQAQGFDVNIGGGSAGAVGSYFFPYGAEKGRTLGPGLENGKPGEYITDRLTDETIKFIDQHQQTSPGQPFFAYLSHYAVHTPFDAKPEQKAKCAARLAKLGGVNPDGYLQKDGQTKKFQDNVKYCAMVASMDESIGRIRAELKRLGIIDNTIIVFTSDNGGLSNRSAQGGREVATSNLPFRAGKGHNYEGGTRIPLVISWPGHVRPGSRTGEFTVNTDHYASLLEMVGLKADSKQALDSVSYVPLLAGGKAPAGRPIYWHSPRPRPGQTGDTATSALQIGSWKYVEHYDRRETDELFDLSKDPYETTNLASTDPKRAAAMRKQLDDWLKSIGAPAPQLDRGDGGKKGKGKGKGKKARKEAAAEANDE